MNEFIELFIMVILPLAITFLIIANRLDSINEEINELKKRIDKLENKKD